MKGRASCSDAAGSEKDCVTELVFFAFIHMEVLLWIILYIVSLPMKFLVRLSHPKAFRSPALNLNAC